MGQILSCIFPEPIPPRLVGKSVTNRIFSEGVELEAAKIIRKYNLRYMIPRLDTVASLSTGTGAVAVGEAVGYVEDSVRRQGRENYVADSAMAGDGLPTGWVLNSSAGITVEIVGAGDTVVDGVACRYRDIRFHGTGTGSGTPSVRCQATTATDALPGQLWTSTATVHVVTGTPTSGLLHLAERNVGGGFLVSSGFSWIAVTEATRHGVSRVFANASTAKADIYFNTTVALDQVIDFTIRIAAPQLERGPASAFTPTSGTAITRGNYAPVYQATTANKPLLVDGVGGHKALQFDGTNDSLQLAEVPMTDHGIVVIGGQYLANTGNWPTIFSGSSGGARNFSIHRNKDTHMLRCDFRGDDGVGVVLASGVELLLNTSFCAAVTRQASVRKLYHNAVLKDTKSDTIGAQTIPAANYRFGEVGTGNLYMNGPIYAAVYGSLPADLPAAEADRIAKVLSEYVNIFTGAF